ncbi:MAG: DUF167 domain-containing protein [Nitrospirota bacterium]
MPDIPPFDLHEDASGVVLKVSVQPRSSREEPAGFYNGALKLKLTAPPSEGAANEACLALLARLFRIPKSRLRILRGHRSRQKWVRIEGLRREMLQKRLKEGMIFLEDGT